MAYCKKKVGELRLMRKFYVNKARSEIFYRFIFVLSFRCFKFVS